MTEGLFTSETGIKSDDSDHPQRPMVTPIVELSPFQRRAIFGDGLNLQKRAEATVTVPASEVVLNVNDGTSAITAVTLPTVSTDTILSLSDLGSVTIPANLTSVSTVTHSDTSRTSTGESSVSTIDGSSISSITSTSSIISSGFNNTSTDTDTSITSTVTVTETSTLQVSVVNGTFYPVVVATYIEEDPSSTETEASFTNTATGLVVTEDPSSYTAAATVAGGAGGPGATATSEAPAATSTQSSGGGGGGAPSLSPQQQQVVGGVVGSVAGVALILVFILFLLRRYRVKLKAQGRLPEQIAERNMLEGGDPPRMSQRSSAIPLTATLASSLRKFRPYSSHTQATDYTASTVPESERGFQKIAGRKIAPVLSTGGDGYGGDYGAFAKETGAGPSGHQRNESSLADSSFYRDSQGFYGGKGTDSPTYPPSPTVGTVDEKVEQSSARDFAGPVRPAPSRDSSMAGRPEGTAALRPSPARTPVTISPAPSSIRLPIQQTPDMLDAPPMPPLIPGLQVPDGVGRTLASQDGSRISARSRGSARSRFAENV